jgi:hypothetical protein
MKNGMRMTEGMRMMKARRMTDWRRNDGVGQPQFAPRAREGEEEEDGRAINNRQLSQLVGFSVFLRMERINPYGH